MALSEDQREAFKFGFARLDPLQRSWSLVGFYMLEFSLLENEVDLTIDSALQLKPITITVLGRHLEMSAKLDVLRTFADLALNPATLGGPPETPEQAAARKRTLKGLTTIQETHLNYRNMVAHSVYQPGQDGCDGVTFVTVKAKGKLKVEGVDWSIDAFFDRALEMRALREGLKGFRKDIKASGFHKALLAAVPSSVSEILDAEGAEAAIGKSP